MIVEFVSQSTLKLGRNRPQRTLERKLDKIAFPVPEIAKCTNKSCNTYGDYKKCYEDFLNCNKYSPQTGLERFKKKYGLVKNG